MAIQTLLLRAANAMAGTIWDNMGQPLQALPRLGDSGPCTVEYESIKWRKLGCFLGKGTHFHEVLSQFL